MTRTRWADMDTSRILAKSGGRCAYCGVILGYGWHIDHRIPVALGGTDHLNNLSAACRSCNLRKGTLTATEFIEWLAENGEAWPNAARKATWWAEIARWLAGT